MSSDIYTGNWRFGNHDKCKQYFAVDNETKPFAFFYCKQNNIQFLSKKGYESTKEKTLNEKQNARIF